MTPTAAHLASNFRLVTIQPRVATTATEGNSGSAQATVRVDLSHRVSVPVTVAYAPHNGEGFASHPEDFGAPSGTLTFQPGETSKTVPFNINGDSLDETDELALIALTNPTNATVGGFGVAGVTITDDD